MMGRPLDLMTFEVGRRPGAWVDGVWTPGTGSIVSLRATIPQPVGPETLEMLPEGARSTARYTIYAEASEPELYLIEQERPDYAADIVTFDSWGYLVTTLEKWAAPMPLGYRAYILLEYGPDEKGPA